jgi:hypothetical protein
MESWLSQAKTLPSLQVEIGFLIQDSFYYGPDRFSDIADRERLADTLVPPRIQREFPSLVTSSEAVGHERELAAYYRRIVGLAHHHQRPFNSIRHYFWLRLLLWNAEHEVSISFPWYDSFSDIDRFLTALVGIDTGLVDHDMDQGWELQTYASDGVLYLSERDPDSGETHVEISVPRAGLVAQVEELRERTTAVVTQISSLLGADVWTAYVGMEPGFSAEPPWSKP